MAILPLFGQARPVKELENLAAMLPDAELMPVLFLGHGSPMNAIEDNDFVGGWHRMARSLQKPKAILCISAHWETSGTFVTAMEKPRTIHDFGGFPPELFRVQYPAPGDPVLAKEISAMISEPHIGLDAQWGLDHGCWSVIMHLFPHADVPVLQLSLDRSRDAAYHYHLGSLLSSLRRKGVLIVGSGNMVHNLGMLAWEQLNTPGYGFEWALAANEKMKSFILSGDHQSMIRYRNQGKEFNLAIPTPEHYLPLLYILALQQSHERVTFFNDQAVAGSLTMTSLRIS